MRIRPAGDEEVERLVEIAAAAFPEEDLTGLTRRLASDGSGALALVADTPDAAGDQRVEGFAVFTPCRVRADGESAVATLLGPLAVSPDRQGVGLASALVRDGLGRARDSGARCAFVLGDPAYYARFGFAPTAVAPAYPIPEDWSPAWRALGLQGAAPTAGRLDVPAIWRDPALWAP